MAALWALVVLACIWTVVAIAALVGVGVYLVRSRGEESCCEDCDDWMAVADVVSDEHAAGLRIEGASDFYDTDAPGLEGFTPLEAATLQRNYLPMTDDERFRLDMAFLSIANNHEGV